MPEGCGIVHVLFRRHRYALYTSGFVDEATCYYSGLYGRVTQPQQPLLHAQTSLIRFVVDLLDNLFYNKSAASRNNGA